jgi:hypothetical protein
MIERALTKGDSDICASEGHGEVTLGNLGDVKDSRRCYIQGEEKWEEEEEEKGSKGAIVNDYTLCFHKSCN